MEEQYDEVYEERTSGSNEDDSKKGTKRMEVDIFGKLDDLLFKPVESVCKWVEEPLKALSSKREKNKMETAANLEKEMRQQEVEMQAWHERQTAELQVDQRRWNAEIDQMINEQEDARRDKLVEWKKESALTAER